MDNPYWLSEGQRHHVNLEAIRLLCFELLCISEASQPLVKSMEDIELEEGHQISEADLSLLRLHQRYAFNQLSKALLQLALMVRTYDDQMRDSEICAEYLKHLDSIDQGHVGILDGDGSLPLRVACNKVIHAIEVRPLFERLDRQINDQGLDQDLWYLTGEIELVGRQQGNPWRATLHLHQFLDLILDSISLGDPY